MKISQLGKSDLNQDTVVIRVIKAILKSSGPDGQILYKLITEPDIYSQLLLKIEIICCPLNPYKLKGFFRNRTLQNRF